MGNVQPLKPKKDKNTLQVTEKFLQEFQKHVLLLDNAVLAIAKAVDTMSLLSEKCLEKDIKGGDIEEKLEAKVRKTMSASISGSKAVLVACVQDFFRFIAEEGSNYVEYAGDLICCLKLRAYDQDRTSQDENNDFVISFLKGTFSTMKDEITTLTMELAVQEEENNKLLKRIEFLQATAVEYEKNMEQKTHPLGKTQEEATKSRHADKGACNKCKEIKVMEKQHKATKSNLTDKHGEYSELPKSGSSKSSLKTLESQRGHGFEIGETRKHDQAPSTQVLTYRQSVAVRLHTVGHFNAEDAKQKMLAAIQEIFTKEAVYVEVIGKDQSVEVDMPRLIICQHHLRSNTEEYVLKAIGDIKPSSSSAIIVFHDTEESQLGDSKEEVMNSLINVGIVFHIILGTSSFKCASNVINVEGIVNFIKENGTFETSI